MRKIQYSYVDNGKIWLDPETGKILIDECEMLEAKDLLHLKQAQMKYPAASGWGINCRP